MNNKGIWILPAAVESFEVDPLNNQFRVRLLADPCVLGEINELFDRAGRTGFPPELGPIVVEDHIFYGAYPTAAYFTQTDSAEYTIPDVTFKYERMEVYPKGTFTGNNEQLPRQPIEIPVGWRSPYEAKEQ